MKRSSRVIFILMLVFVLVAAMGCQTTNTEPNSNQQQGPNGNSDSNLAEGSNDISKLIADSYSAKKFLEQQVDDQAIQQILKSGAKAPSARNLQPWHFTVVKNSEMVSELASHAANGCVVCK